MELFGIRDDEHHGGWFYRFQYYHPEEGEFLRYDSAHADDDLGWHDRHVQFDEDTEIPFQNFVSHIALFQEIAEPINTEHSNP